MKRILLILLLAALLAGCASGVSNTAVQVSILEGEGFTVMENGIQMEPGGDAAFLLEIDPGFTVGSTDYPGKTSLSIRDGKTELALHGITYPTRVTLELTDRFGVITYDPNGGEGECATLVYPQNAHLRPNTERALFTREGHTLVSWNTAPDGTGERIGLGSRVSAAQEGVTLYAQWTPWAPETDFTYTVGEGITITGYQGQREILAIPETIGGKTVTGIAHNAFQNVSASALILPKTIRNVALGAFQNCSFVSVTIFDTIESIAGGSFRNCENLKTLYINAVEDPAGAANRKESVYADKADLLIAAAGQKKLVCYGGCAMWYNLDAAQFQRAFGQEYAIINMGLNGVVNSALQMQILLSYMEPGDILFHAPELASSTQMMKKTAMDQNDDLLWCGLEYNYDLVSRVDFLSVPGLLESFCGYLSRKSDATDYHSAYSDSQGRSYLDPWGSIPFEREMSMERLSDAVTLHPASVNDLQTLRGYYDRFREKDVTVYVSFAPTNLDALPEEERGNAAATDTALHKALTGEKLISRLEDFLYTNADFYDTNYHLLSEAAKQNTALWLRDLAEALEVDAP